MNLPSSNGKAFKGHAARNVDWDQPIEGGPTDVGFDYYHGISASLDMPPYIHIENDRFQGRATVTKAFHRKGAAHPDFEAIDVLPEIGRQAVDFIRRQDGSKPFFVYVPFTSPHTPILPTPEWQGKSPIGRYGDFQMQTDAVIGQIVAAVDAAGFTNNTVVIVTSDNGCSKAAKIDQMIKKATTPAPTCAAPRPTSGTAGTGSSLSCAGPRP